MKHKKDKNIYEKNLSTGHETSKFRGGLHANERLRQNRQQLKLLS